MNGRKDDAGKRRPGLVLRSMGRAVDAVIDVAEYGAKKYAPDNWLQVQDGGQRYTDAMLRHLLASLRGEDKDPESGLPHMAHAAWCALAVLELGLRPRVLERVLQGFDKGIEERVKVTRELEEAPGAPGPYPLGAPSRLPGGIELVYETREQEGVNRWARRMVDLLTPPARWDPLRDGTGPVKRISDILDRDARWQELKHAGLIKSARVDGDGFVVMYTGNRGGVRVPAAWLDRESSMLPRALELLTEQRPSIELQKRVEERLGAVARSFHSPVFTDAVKAGRLITRYRWSSKRPAVYVQLRDRANKVLWSVKEPVRGPEPSVEAAFARAWATFLKIPGIWQRVKEQVG